MALGYAAIALAVLALLIPVLLSWKVRKQRPEIRATRGGAPVLALVFASGVAIILIQLAMVAGWLPSIS